MEPAKEARPNVKLSVTFVLAVMLTFVLLPEISMMDLWWIPKSVSYSLTCRVREATCNVQPRRDLKHDYSLTLYKRS